MHTAALIDLRDRLEHEHAEQLKEFQSHQKCLVTGDARHALEILVCFENQLVNHIELEERYLLPLCEPNTDRPGHWGPHIYAQEHKRIRELLTSLRMRVAAHCVKTDDAMTPAEIIDLLDEEKVLKHLVAHHQMREATALYPGIFSKIVA